MTALPLLTVGALLAAPIAAAPEPLPPEDPAEETFELLPGASRAITHSHSASRDTALLAYQQTPYTVRTGGGDVGLARLNTGALSWRLGFFGMIELESEDPIESDDLSSPMPQAGNGLWRGVYGYSIAAAHRDWGERWFGERGMVEAAISFRHESEHFTGSREGNEGRYAEVPNIGDFFMPELAVRIPVGDVDIELRAQHKWFVGEPGARTYSHGPGGDAIVIWRLWDQLHPFNATFAEYLFGTTFEDDDGTRYVAPDNYLFRNLTGVMLPGRYGDIQLYASLAIGHGKGLKAFQKERRWGGGIRLVFF